MGDILGLEVGITLVIGIITTIWFFIGGVYDIRDMIITLKTAKRNTLDDGMVVDHHNLGEQTEDVKLIEEIDHIYIEDK